MRVHLRSGLTMQLLWLWGVAHRSACSAFLLPTGTIRHQLLRPAFFFKPLLLQQRPSRVLIERRATNVSLTDADAGTESHAHASTSQNGGTNSEERAISQSEKQYYDADQDEVLVSNADSLPVGSKEGFAVVHHFTFSPNPQEWDNLLQEGRLPAKDVARLHLTPDNVTLPVALMMMDPDKFPTISRARKFCRHGRILLHRGPLGVETLETLEDNGQQILQERTVFLPEKVSMGKVGDRVLKGDVIGRQVAVGSGYFSALQQKKGPPFELPVVYEDDHFALVNKPAGVVVYSPKNAGQGILTIKSALPHTLQPPQAGTLSALKRPKSVHRLDKPTSGILVIGKTLPAMDHLSRQFRLRTIQKTYTAVVNGCPKENPDMAITSQQAYDLGVDVDPTSQDKWQLIDSPLEGKHAVTVWRVLRQVPSIRARDNVLTLVEVKPKTGRYHQIRRHMAWVCDRAIVGDKEYDGNHQNAVKLRGRGLFLCSNRATLEHPFYNTRAGREVFDALSEMEKSFEFGELFVRRDEDAVLVRASIPLPQKFHSFLDKSEAVYKKYGTETVNIIDDEQ